MLKSPNLINSIIVLILLNTSVLVAQLNELNFGNYSSENKYYIEVSYGTGNLKNEKNSTNFNPYSQSEIILGKRFIKPILGSKVISFTDNYLSSSYIRDYVGNNKEAKINFNIWRFGLRYRIGYGYRFRNLSIMPYNHIGFSWNKCNFSSLFNVETTQYLSNELKKINVYNNAIKFGTSHFGGIDIRLSKMFGIGASYEAEVIFPQHIFWKQFGSFLIETLSLTSIDYLTEGVIIKAIPSLTPIIYFFMKNGLSYYFFTLKQDNMNWPFATRPPLTLETFKISLKITF